MKSDVINISSNGAIILGDKITCDGFVYGYPYRVQTHIHQDHMSDFDTSKGYQNIVLSQASRDLLIIEHDADIACRRNIIAIPLNNYYSNEETKVELLSNGHMLGSCQVAVHLADGMKAGYSGDFSWPLEKVINVDSLVVDTTYGSPNSIRKYSNEDACSRFVQLVSDKIKQQSLAIKAFRGTLQNALDLLDCMKGVPIISSSKLIKVAEIYRKYGYNIGKLIDINSDTGKSIISSERHIHLFGFWDRMPYDPCDYIVINLSAFMTNFREPLFEFSPKAYRISLCNHADFNGTLEYVEATGAREVITDNSRGGHAVELAVEIKRRLNLSARPSEQIVSMNWGE